MNRPVFSHVLLWGIIGGILIAFLKWTEYRFLVIQHSLQIYGGLTAATFAGLGIWLGLRFSPPRQPATAVTLQPPPQPAPQSEPFAPDNNRLESLGITRRELEILNLIALGLSNREIATQLFVSENTVKTHCSRAFDKLGARRRTQAVQLAKQFRILP